VISRPVARFPMTITWGDCDAAGIAYYARYFDWFTNGRMNYLNQFKLPYMDTFHDQGVTIVGIKAECEYKLMLRPDENVILETSLADLTKTRVNFNYRVIKSDGSVAACGYSEHAFVDKTGKPFNLYKRYPEIWHKLDVNTGGSK